MRTAACYEYWIGEFDNREMPQVTQVDNMARYAKRGEREGKAIDEREERVQGYDAVDEAREDAAREDGVFFD